jgi:drug/metabolite transporter (DMT)-like permease
MSALTPRTAAVFALLAAAGCWGLSFPLMKGLLQMQQQAHPESGTWFLSSWGLAIRFLIAAAIVAWWCRSQLRNMTRAEVSQAAGLGIFTAGGMLLQMDGLNYIQASASAFITQGYCIFLPLVVAVMTRTFPRPHVLVAVVMVMAGVGILAGLDWRDLKLGRGEIETLLASMVFTAQIMWVERPGYTNNHMGRVSALAFAITGLSLLPLTFATMPSWGHLGLVYNNAPAIGCLVGLTLVSTLAGMLLMFIFQRGVGAVSAGIIYSTEPIFASLLAFFVPSIISAWSGITYANESLTSSLLIGGALILAANLVVQLKPTRTPRSDVTSKSR